MKIRKTLFRVLNKYENTFKALVLSSVFLFIMGVSNSSFAAAPKLITGTKDLAEAVSGWLTLIIAAASGAMVGYHALMKSLADDDAVIADKNRKIKNTLIGGAIATTASGLVAAFLNFYK